MRVLGISGSLRAGSHNSKLLRAAAELLPPGAELEMFDGLKAIPPYDEDDEHDPPRRGAGAARGDRGRRRRPDRHARVQRLHPRRAQERARLGLAAARDEPAARQARRRRRRLDRHVRRRLGAGRGAQGPAAIGARVLDRELPVAEADERFDADGRSPTTTSHGWASILAELRAEIARRGRGPARRPPRAGVVRPALAAAGSGSAALEQAVRRRPRRRLRAAPCARRTLVARGSARPSRAARRLRRLARPVRPLAAAPR